MVRVFAIAYSPEWAANVERLFSRRHDVKLVKTVFGNETVLAQLETYAPDIIAVEGSTDWESVRRITRSIMQAHPMPVVILVSRNDSEDEESSSKSLDAGALSLLTIPAAGHNDEYDIAGEQLAKSLRLMAEVKVVRRWDSTRLESLTRAHHELAAAGKHPHRVYAVCIGASAGGTNALQEVFSHLPQSFPLPILVVQHIAKGYVAGLVRWLGEQTAMRICIAEDGMPLEGGTIYVAPDDRHLTVDRKHCILLVDDEPVNGFKPSIARLFRSVHESYGGSAVAVLLSGMGNDGAQEMRRLHDAGAITIAQDKDTSLIHGIPGEAIKLAAVTSVLPVQEISSALLTLANRPCQHVPEYPSASGPENHA